VWINILYPVSDHFSIVQVEFGVMVSPFTQIEQGVVGRVFAELMVGRVDAVFEGTSSDAFGWDEERRQVSFGFFVVYSK